MGYMKELDIRIRNGGDDAVAAVQRIGEDWRLQLDAAAGEVERLRSRLRLADAAIRSESPTLTDEEREAIEKAIGRELDAEWYGGKEPDRVVALRGLLDRTK